MPSQKDYDAAVEYFKNNGARDGTSWDDVKKVHRKIALKWHQDRNPDNKELAHIKFSELRKHYEIIEAVVNGEPITANRPPPPADMPDLSDLPGPDFFSSRRRTGTRSRYEGQASAGSGESWYYTRPDEGRYNYDRGYAQRQMPSSYRPLYSGAPQQSHARVEVLEPEPPKQKKREEKPRPRRKKIETESGNVYERVYLKWK